MLGLVWEQQYWGLTGDRHPLKFTVGGLHAWQLGSSPPPSGFQTGRKERGHSHCLPEQCVSSPPLPLRLPVERLNGSSLCWDTIRLAHLEALNAGKWKRDETYYSAFGTPDSMFIQSPWGNNMEGLQSLAWPNLQVNFPAFRSRIHSWEAACRLG